MIIGLDRSFKPEWVYKILKLCKPGLTYMELEPEFNSIIEYDGLKSKINVMTIIKRYYLQLKDIKGKKVFDENYLHKLSLSYSFDTMKPLLLFVLLCKCEIAQFLQEKINLKYYNKNTINRKELLNDTIMQFGDRRIIKYAVGYYLQILANFDIIVIENKDYKWKNQKFICTDYIIRDMILLYSYYKLLKEIDVSILFNDIVFTYIDILEITDILKKFNIDYWTYQNDIGANKIIIGNDSLM